jgi:hypothetical protein
LALELLVGEGNELERVLKSSITRLTKRFANGYGKEYAKEGTKSRRPFSSIIWPLADKGRRGCPYF